MTDSAFDAWYGEVEGYAVRAERLTAPKDELEAAFEAGVEAERERAANDVTAMADGLYEKADAEGIDGRDSAFAGWVVENVAAAIRNP